MNSNNNLEIGVYNGLIEGSARVSAKASPSIMVNKERSKVVNFTNIKDALNEK